MTRRPYFWTIFGALAAAGVVAAVTLFSTAFPSISVDIDMDRGAAIDSAATLAERSGWGEAGDRSAATFGLVDPIVQTYVELEGGGPEVVERLAERDVYAAYQWRVRRFSEGRVEEVSTRFKPSGEPYGFRLRLAEEEPGDGNRGSDEARSLAEETASDWGVDLAAYELVESSAETMSAGRVDHTFVYERSDERLAEARFRLRLVIAGSRAAELTHFVQVPEAFTRRYADMRSTNDTIALVAQAVLLVVFGLFGAGVGSALLLRARWLEWRVPLAWGAVIAGLFGAATVNQLPLTWSSYDTALSATSFVLQQLAGGAAIALLGTPLIAFFLLAGESLGRRAFPGHVQQWRFWAPEVASSNTALGMTLAAYLMVGLQVGYVVLFYLGTRRLEGWWSPADALVQPDLLATYLPWLEAVSLALFASFWEESLFRAVPIACAALLGSRFGRRGLWIWGAVLLQAVVFAAGHANYPQQPPYARVIELTVPALVWGVVYVRYGLVPTIMAHFLYDLALISIVLFESEALVDQGVIVAVGLVPLGVVLAARRRMGSRARPPEWAFNGSWVPASRASPDVPSPGQAGAAVGSVPEAPAQSGQLSTFDPVVGSVQADAGPRPARWSPRLPGWSVGVALVLGLAALVLAVSRTTPPPPLPDDRSTAIAAADAALADRGVQLDEWDVFVTTASGASDGMEYVYREAGPEEYDELVGRYFGVTRWLVRLVDWDAEPEERVEEYRVFVGAEGEAPRVSHTLPEERPGASLDVEAGRALALEAIRAQYGLDASELREVEAQETSRPARRDWLFTFSEVGLLQGVEGEARIRVRIAGDEVTEVGPTIQVPEEWQRDRRRLQSRSQIMGGGLSLLLLFLFGGATVTAVVVWSRSGLPVDIVVKLTGVAFLALVASTANDWPTTTAVFGTGQPWSFQVNATIIGLVIASCVASPAIGLVGALGHAWVGRDASPRPRFCAAVGYGLLFGGLALLAPTLSPGPQVGRYVGAASAVPLAAPALGVVPAFLVLTGGALCVLAFKRRFGHHGFVPSTIWSLVVATAIVLVPPELQESLLTWGLTAVLVFSVLAAGLLVCDAEPGIVPGVVATVLAVGTLGDGWWGPYAGARMGGVSAAVVLAVLGWAWMRKLAGAGSRGQSLVETRASVGNE